MTPCHRDVEVCLTGQGCLTDGSRRVNPNMINSIECEIIVEQSRQPERLLGASHALAELAAGAAFL